MKFSITSGILSVLQTLRWRATNTIRIYHRYSDYLRKTQMQNRLQSIYFKLQRNAWGSTAISSMICG